MDNNNPRGMTDGHKQVLADLGITPERMREISTHVKELFNQGDSQTLNTIRTLTATYQGEELVMASMGLHNLLRGWEQEQMLKHIVGQSSSL